MLSYTVLFSKDSGITDKQLFYHISHLKLLGAHGNLRVYCSFLISLSLLTKEVGRCWAVGDFTISVKNNQRIAQHCFSTRLWYYPGPTGSFVPFQNMNPYSLINK